MEPLPKIARERLRASHVVEHPDDDLLTAFAEQGLTTLERSQVANHLSGCAECRKVLALATEAKPPADNAALATKSISGSRGRLLSWPVLRWGALAACVVVLSAVGLLLTQRSFHPPEKISANAQSEKTTAEIDQRSSNQPSAISAPSSAAELKKRTPSSEPDIVAQFKVPGPTPERKEFLILPEGRADKKDAGSLAFAPGVAGKVVAEKPSQVPVATAHPRSNSVQASLDAAASSHGEQVANAAPAASTDQKATAQAIGKDEQPERVPAMSETVEVTAEAPTLQTQSTAVMAKSARSKLKTENKAVAGGTTNNELAATAAITNGSRLMRDVNAAQWTLSGDGVPQRSFDSGKTWEKVQVDHHKSFRALSAQGMDVWVGGLAGVLYHSSDVGLHWTRIIPVAESSTLTGDILTIDFRDPLHGKLTTANRESWITADAGKTWQKE
jgi:photosynthesis system II assembly factor YCF48-like protein/putative zinc finger protein